MLRKPIISIALMLICITAACLVAYAYLPANKPRCKETMQDCCKKEKSMPGQMIWETVSGQFTSFTGAADE